MPGCGAEYKDIEVSSLVFDASEAREGSLFFCLRGRDADGHDFIGDAAKNGAVAAVAEEERESAIPLVLVGDARAALAIASGRFYGSPAEKLKLFAVTGTNGKTTTAYMLKSIFEAAGFSAGVIGTNGAEYAGKRTYTGMTTPDPPQLHALLADMARAGVTHVAMEVSAHALALKKTEGIKFAAAGFSNLTRDHLDFFGDMETYKRAKFLLFEPSRAEIMCVNADDPAGKELLSRGGIPAISYGFSRGAVLSIRRFDPLGETSAAEFSFGGRIIAPEIPIRGRYNVQNAALATAMALAAGIEPSAAVRGLKNLRRVDGRFETYYYGGKTIIIDFAHTDDGLKNLLAAAREMTVGRLITVFGCGGDRDRTKRPIMGRVAYEHSDFVIITSDNPRSERPEAIISDIAEGIKGVENVDYRIEPDRKKAITGALLRAAAGDTVVIAGKGAENYIEAGGVKYPYSDREFVLGLIEKRKRQ